MIEKNNHYEGDLLDACLWLDLAALMHDQDDIDPAERIASIRRVSLEAGGVLHLSSGLDLPSLATSASLLKVASEEIPSVRRLSQRIILSGMGCWDLPLAQEYDDDRRARYPSVSGREVGRQATLAHRFVLLAIGGKDYTLGRFDYVDHICRSHACCNPSHLEVITPGQNTTRGIIARRAIDGQDRLPLAP